MILKEIDAERDKIYASINERRLNDAFKHIEVLLELGTSPELSSRLEGNRTAYSYMTEYFLQGIEDPYRDKLYNDIVESLYEITDTLFDDIKINEVSDYVYDKRRYYKLKDTADLNKYASLLKAEEQKYKLMKDAGAEDSQLISSLKNIENIQEEIFGIIASSSTFTEEESGVIQMFLNDKEFGYVSSSLVVSALTISALYFFSEKKILTLLETYFSSNNEEIKQRALSGALILLFIHRERINISQEINKRIELFSDDFSFCKDVRNQFLHFIRCLETENISQTLMREIISDIFKHSSDIQNKILSKGLNDDNIMSILDTNSEGDNNLDTNGLSKKIDKLKQMSDDGFDVVLSQFAPLKNYTFFNNISNWLRPYTNENSDILLLLKKDGRFGDLFNNSTSLCSSDKYSLALTFNSYIEKENVKFDSPQKETEKVDYFAGDDIDFSDRASNNISALYIQDLYRLFTLSKFKLPNIFEYHINLFDVEPLSLIFDDDECLRLIGELYLKKGYYYFAQPYFKRLIKRDVSDYVSYQKLGWCKQMLRDYNGAIDQYIKADQIFEDIWTTNQLAICYKELGNLSKAIEYYRDALRIKPDTISCEIQLAECLLQSKKYEEALKLFYKADFITGGSPKIWKHISWCSLMLFKFDQAETYYKKVLSSNPEPNDYINMGHVCLAQKMIKKACEFYKKGIELNSKDRRLFEKNFSNKYKALLELGVSEKDILIIRDIFTQKDRK